MKFHRGMTLVDLIMVVSVIGLLLASADRVLRPPVKKLTPEQQQILRLEQRVDTLEQYLQDKQFENGRP